MRCRKFVLVVIFSLVFLSGCIAENKKLPAVEVTFTHYVAGKDHYIHIINAKPVLVESEKVKNVYENPPFPGIHVFAYIFGENRRFVTPVTYVPLNKEGNLTVYIGFSSPEKVPKKGEALLVVVDVVEKVDGKFKSVATDKEMLIWNLTWSEK